jgi:hypothetical protein
MTELRLANRVEEAIVRAEPAPAFTKSWHPFSHAQVLDAMAEAVAERKLEIVKKEYSLQTNAQHVGRMIGCWEIAGPDGRGYNHGLSILNATDQTSAVVLGAYEKIFICSNFCFRMETEKVVFRRHTGGLTYEELLYLSRESLGLLLPKFERLSAWHAAMRETRLSGAQAALLTVAAMQRALIPPARFPAFFDSLGGMASEKYGDDRGTLWGWHAAATEIMNENSILTIVWKQDQLNYFMDQEVPILLARGSDGSFELTHDSLKAIEQEGFVGYKGWRAMERAELTAASAEIKRGYEEQKAAKAKEEKAKATKKAQQKAARIEAEKIKEERKAAIASSPKTMDKAFRKKKREISKRIAARAAAEGAKIPSSLMVEPRSVKAIEEE